MFRRSRLTASMPVRLLSVLALAATAACGGSTMDCRAGSVCGNDNKVAQPAPSASGPPGKSSPPSPTASSSPEAGRPSGAVQPPPVRSAAPAAKSIESCRDWVQDIVPGVDARSCVRREGDNIFMVADWRSTRPVTIDVYLWLEDKSGQEVVYPADSVPVPFSKRSSTDSTRAEGPVGMQLAPGTVYNVCLSVLSSGSPKPNISSPAVKGIMKNFMY